MRGRLGADPNHSSADGLTPLMLTATCGTTTEVQLLLGARANMEVKDVVPSCLLQIV